MNLDADFNVIGSAADDDGPGDQEDPGDERSPCALCSSSSQPSFSSLSPRAGGSEEPTGQEPTSSSTTQATEARFLPQGDEPFALDPARLVTGIDNLDWPTTQGSSWVYRESDRQGRCPEVVVTVTDKEKMILGIPATVAARCR